LWNGFPLLQYDTGGYLARWFEGYLVEGRSTTYGLLLAAGWPLDFWPVIILQAAAAVWVISLVLRIHRFNLYPIGLFAIIASVAVTTALPWLASILLTDIFAGLAVLAFHALVWHDDRIAPRERIALVIFIAFAVSTHSATYAVLLALSLAAMLLSLINSKLMARRAWINAAAAMVLGAAMLLAGNYVLAKRLAWTPGGYGLAFSRMLQDGVVTRYLNDHCQTRGCGCVLTETNCPWTASSSCMDVACSTGSAALLGWAMKCAPSCSRACATIPSCN
jgi:hypothetical protein